jgi:hypothetical protein
MKCPLSNHGLHPSETGERVLPADCILNECAWWNEYFGKCCIAVDAYLKGIEDHRLEIKQTIKDRY